MQLSKRDEVLRDLEAERVTHSGETHRELMRRLERERPVSPFQARLRRERFTARQIEIATRVAEGKHQ